MVNYERHIRFSGEGVRKRQRDREVLEYYMFSKPLEPQNMLIYEWYFLGKRRCLKLEDDGPDRKSKQKQKRTCSQRY